MKANEILESCLYVDDLDAAQDFYRNVLGLELFEQQEGRHLFWRCGQRMLLLFLAAGSDVPGSSLPRHGAHGAGHVAFAVPDRDIPQWKQHLEHCGVDIERFVDWPQGGRSVYFRDPAGNSLEVASPRIWGIQEHAAIACGGSRSCESVGDR
jgi:catechol 2,3-dioxygenase-like lactoylglutathione lyase family enzyme